MTTHPASFGAYRSSDLTAATGRGDVTVKCTCTLLDCVALGYTLDIQSGGSGSVSARKMTRSGGSETLNYQLYVDVLTVTPWVSAQPEIYPLALFGGSQTIFVYGRAPAGQVVKPGSYSDAPLVVVSF